MSFAPRCLLSLALVAFLSPLAAKEETKPAAELGALKFRLIGPNVGGRVARVAGVPGDPLTYYAAVAQGGVWKSSNGGREWAPIFDEQFTTSVGSLALAPSDPNVIYVGSGEANIRGNVSLGWGIWKSVDAGKTWARVWENRGQIGTMAVHPRNPDIAFAAVLGSPFGPSDTRGVYRTRDGGKTWQRVLFKNADTGASDVAFDPNNPNILYAGLWQMRRTPWALTSGGPGSGLYRSRDGGDTWTALTGAGLPEGDWGKVGVAIAPSDSQRVYALIEAKEGGLFRADDGGDTWTRVSAHRSLRQRAWYYTTMTVDPRNADVLWFPQVPLLKSIDGGKTVVSIKGPHHGDHHDVWIDPKNNQRLISANDGGVDISTDGGKTWFAPDLPLGQFYNIDVDNRLPYHVGGTLQDMGTVSGPSRGLDGDGATLADWRYVGGGEAGDFKYDTELKGHVYAGEYGGFLSHYVEQTGQYRVIMPYPVNPSGHPASDWRYRFQWTAPVALSPHHAGTLYHGGNVLFQSDDRGDTWREISPDLTRNDRAKQGWSGGPITGDITTVEYYNTIFSIAESPLAKGTIWVGTDDGLVHVTRDGGGQWDNVTAKAWPEWATIEGIEPSRVDAGTAYVVVDAHRLDDFRPYVFRTRDHGKRWEKLVDGLPADLHAFALREDVTDANVLYLGTERGVWYSRDAGAHWAELKAGLPPVAVVDLEVRHGDLIVGTRGRAAWVLDDVAAFTRLPAAKSAGAAQVFPAPRAVRWRADARWDSQGQIANAPYGALLSYWLPAEPKGEITLTIRDDAGKLVRTLSSVARPARHPPDDPDEPESKPEADLTKTAGLNRVYWNLRHDGARRLERAKLDAGDPETGPLVVPGRYALTLDVDGKTTTGSVEVIADPRWTGKPEDMRANLDFALTLRGEIDRAVIAVDTVRALREQIADLDLRLAGHPAREGLVKLIEDTGKTGETLEGLLHNPTAEVVYDVLAGRDGGAKLISQLSPLYDWVQSSDHAPTAAMQARHAELASELAAIEARIAQWRDGPVKQLEQAAADAGLPRFVTPTAERAP